MMSNKKYNDIFMEEVVHTINDKLELILAQTTKTNGRVSSIENWKSAITGGMIVITSLVMPIAFKLFFK